MADRKERLDNRAYYDRFAERYEIPRHAGYHLMVDDLESDLVEQVAAGKEALEVGCGTGLILQRVDHVAARAIGLDLSAGMLERARSRALKVTLGSATALPFADESFDVTYSFKVLAHVEELECALAEMARVTRRGGRLFIELYNKLSLRYLTRRLRGGHEVADGIEDDQVYVRFHTPNEMRRLLPQSVALLRWHGVRLFTTVPSMVGWPFVGRGLRAAERACRSGPLARLGGFLVMECERF
jgi:SAM-dependent methyltransferase